MQVAQIDSGLPKYLGDSGRGRLLFATQPLRDQGLRDPTDLGEFLLSSTFEEGVMNGVHEIVYNVGNTESQYSGYWTDYNHSDKREDMTSRQDFFRELLKEKGASQEEAAREIGISQPMLSKFIHFKPGSRSKYITEIAEYFGLTPQECLEGRRLREGEIVEERPRLHRYHVISWVHAGELHEIEERVPSEFIEDTVYTVKDYGERVVALRVVGDSMEPEFHDGETIIVSGDSDWRSGDFVVARNVSTNVATIKKYVFDSGKHLLLPLNRQYDKIEMNHEWVILGKVRQASREY